MTTYWCVRCVSTYIYGYDPVTGRGGLVQLCDCGTPTPGYFMGREWVEGVSETQTETREPPFLSRTTPGFLRLKNRQPVSKNRLFKARYRYAT